MHKQSEIEYCHISNRFLNNQMYILLPLELERWPETVKKRIKSFSLFKVELVKESVCNFVQVASGLTEKNVLK